MTKYVLKRLFLMIPVLIAVTVIVFGLSAISAGDPARIIAEKTYEHPTQSEIEKVRHEQGFDRPFVERYLKWLKGALRGDLGDSYASGKPALQELFKRFPETLKIGILAFVLLVLIPIPLGIISAVKQTSILDKLIGVFAFFSVSMPPFWMGLMLLYFFGVKLRVIPIIGGAGPGIALLAALTLDIGYFGMVIRLVRTNLSEVLKQDYIRGLKARGIPGWKIVMKHAMKNILLPVITHLSTITLSLLCGSALIESIFSIPGIGEMAINAVHHHDIPVLQSFILMLSIIVVVTNIVVDIVYAFVDKRIQLA